jgi:hypothetical protein
MDTIVCPGCGLRVEPIRVFEKSPKSSQWWRIIKCPRERCNFNIDINECDKPGPGRNKDKPDDGGSFWRPGV